ncbi:MAG TPA: ectonucleotide pyrophosphatase/phosphodiesterase [Pyrinomonadaceae bacterium]|nr:ectonucleotide pyrophosphatase/phosphodiesterase [Pyrinomonadaceae bacterium]
MKPTIILVSLDGFRADYLTKYEPPNLSYLARTGVRAKWLIPSFPSKTYPNHYTIATGLYPQHHGIVENSIYDKEFNAVFTLSKREEVQNGRWWLGEPIWVTAEKQGQKAGSVFFPGTEAEIAGKRPSYWKLYDDKISNAERVDTVLSWLDLPRDERPTCLSLYFSDTDDAGHDFGPDSIETKNAVAKVDGDIGRLIEGLEARRVFGRVNLIIVSDHGMASVDLNNAILLDEIFDTNMAERIFWTREIVSIFPRPGKEEEIYSILNTKLPPHARVYRRSETPARFHYRDSPRIAPLVVLPDEGWSLTNREHFADLKKKGDLQRFKGAHGYDNNLESMRALFIAHGRAFERGKVVEPFENIHVYNIMARILGLTPAKNDGSFAVATDVLR